jgi:hypothetical protein
MRRSIPGSTIALAAALLLAACSGGGGGDAAAKATPTTNDHGMTKQEMLCMSSHYAGHHPDLCPDQQDGYLLKHPLRVTADGLIEPASIDLSGIEGVSPAQQAESTALLARTIAVLPKWSDYHQAEADGFQSIGDSLTGEEHYIHWDWIDDTTMLDPNQPESLVYRIDRATGTKTLEAAMFLLPKQYTLQNQPAIASPLVQFHEHDNLCFTPGAAPRVAGLTHFEGGCNAPLVKFNPNIMVHVWIRPNVCGPFAALLGVGAGQIADGQERSCVHDHTRLGL